MADLPSLVELAQSAGAREVRITAGWCDAVERAFARRKLPASPLGPPQQLFLNAVES
jgi:hypothetical protein